MAKTTRTLTFVNGVAQNAQLPIGTYTVGTINIPGYGNAVVPDFTITKDTTEVTLLLMARGTLTVQVKDDLDNVITAGAVRLSNQTGTIGYGEEKTIGTNGIATFENVPYEDETGITVWANQTATDAYHIVNTVPVGVNMNAPTVSAEIIDERQPISVDATAVDANYPNVLPLSGTIEVTG